MNKEAQSLNEMMAHWVKTLQAHAKAVNVTLNNTQAIELIKRSMAFAMSQHSEEIWGYAMQLAKQVQPQPIQPQAQPQKPPQDVYRQRYHEGDPSKRMSIPLSEIEKQSKQGQKFFLTQVNLEAEVARFQQLFPQVAAETLRALIEMAAANIVNTHRQEWTQLANAYITQQIQAQPQAGQPRQGKNQIESDFKWS